MTLLYRLHLHTTLFFLRIALTSLNVWYQMPWIDTYGWVFTQLNDLDLDIHSINEELNSTRG